jgi:hypothetical protein
MAPSFQGHVHHDIAPEWFESLDDRDDARLCFCRIARLSLLRLITTEAAMGKDEVPSQRRAWDGYDRWFEDSRVFFLEEPAIWEKCFAEFRSRPVRLPRTG